MNGGREASNGFMVNGANVEEGRNNGTAIIPNLDSIAEFRIITSNFDAEYGNYSGGQVNVATKSGTNQFHGSAFEFLRNTDLNARNYFSPTRGVFQQNIFGATFGGPIKKNSTFFFVDYQGTRLVQAPTVTTTVPSLANRTGDLSDQADSLTGSVVGPNWANTLSQRLGYTVTDGEPYYTPGCADPTTCVFPNAQIPHEPGHLRRRVCCHMFLVPIPTTRLLTSPHQHLRSDYVMTKAAFVSIRTLALE